MKDLLLGVLSTVGRFLLLKQQDRRKHAIPALTRGYSLTLLVTLFSINGRVKVF